MSTTVTVDRYTDRAAARFRDERESFWNSVAGDPQTAFSNSYRDRLTEVYRFLIPPEQTVIELGSGTGDLLAAVQPQLGVGVDFASEMVSLARSRHPDITFVQADAHDFTPGDFGLPSTFDVVILSDLVNDVWDVQAVFERIRPLCHADTRVVLNFYNKVWQLPLDAARSVGLAQPVLEQNWLSGADVTNLCRLAGFELVCRRDEIIAPAPLGVVSDLVNRVVPQIWPANHLSLTTFFVVRLAPEAPTDRPSVSVVVPARNEAGNIEAIIERTPMMGSRTELIFVEGNSTDDTYATIERAIAEPGREHTRLLRQPGKGKGDAVRHGFAHATGDILMILDADMTVAPEELPRFYEAIVSGAGEFINGVRLVYPMEGRAMRPLNYLGNRFFSSLFSWLLRQKVKDTLCGTKVLSRDSYDAIARNRRYFGDFDPFGDFDLLFGASRLNLKIVDLPIRYRDRTYGDTNIDRWRHGALLLRMAAFAAKKLRFV